MGLLAAQWLRIRGCTEVTVADISPAKLEFAVRLGFQAVFSSELKNRKNAFEVCVEACGLSVTRNAAITCCARGGHVFLIGNPADTLEMERSVYSSILRKELSFSGSWNSSPEPDWRDVLAHAGKDLDLRTLITSIRPLREAAETFQELLSGNGVASCKTLLNCQEE